VAHHLRLLLLGLAQVLCVVSELCAGALCLCVGGGGEQKQIGSSSSGSSSGVAVHRRVLYRCARMRHVAHPGGVHQNRSSASANSGQGNSDAEE
jgi:hypothetical protein